jgi:hypothetical protein
MSSCCPVVCEGAWCGEKSLRRWSTMMEKPIKVDLHPGFSVSKVRIRRQRCWGARTLLATHPVVARLFFKHRAWLGGHEEEGGGSGRECGYSQTGRVILQCQEGEMREIERRPPIRQSRSRKLC